MNDIAHQSAPIKSEEHWTEKPGGVKLFLFEKYATDPKTTAGTVLFVHGSSMAAQPTFDLQVPGRPDSSPPPAWRWAEPATPAWLSS